MRGFSPKYKIYCLHVYESAPRGFYQQDIIELTD